METCRDISKGKPLANNTRLFAEDGCCPEYAPGVSGVEYSIVLHSTAVVRLCLDDSYRLDSGGWRTVTTKARINEYAPGKVRCERGVWYWVGAGGRYRFVDGMRVDGAGRVFDANGEALPVVDLDAEKRARRERATIGRRVDKYVSGFIKSLEAGKVKQPGAGDCWGCLFQAADGGKNPLGGASHILGHFDEKYYVPSLLANACKAFGVSILARDYIARCMAGEDVKALGSLVDHVRGQVSKALRRWCLRELGFQS